MTSDGLSGLRYSPDEKTEYKFLAFFKNSQVFVSVTDRENPKAQTTLLISLEKWQSLATKEAIDYRDQLIALLLKAGAKKVA